MTNPGCCCQLVDIRPRIFSLFFSFYFSIFIIFVSDLPIFQLFHLCILFVSLSLSYFFSISHLLSSILKFCMSFASIFHFFVSLSLSHWYIYFYFSIHYLFFLLSLSISLLSIFFFSFCLSISLFPFCLFTRKLCLA